MSEPYPPKNLMAENLRRLADQVEREAITNWKQQVVLGSAAVDGGGGSHRVLVLTLWLGRAGEPDRSFEDEWRMGDGSSTVF